MKQKTKCDFPRKPHTGKRRRLKRLAQTPKQGKAAGSLKCKRRTTDGFGDAESRAESSSLEKERCSASHNLGGTESRPKAKRKLLERRNILGPLLGEVLGSCKSGTGGTGRSNYHELLSSLPGSEGAGGSLVPRALASVSEDPKPWPWTHRACVGLVEVAWATALQGMSQWQKSYHGSRSVQSSFFFFFPCLF